MVAISSHAKNADIRYYSRRMGSGSHPVHTPWGDLGSEIKLLFGTYVDCVSGGLPKELQALPASSSYPEFFQL